MSNEELQEILTTYKWITIKRYNPMDYDNCVDALVGLEEHHISETEFLINKCRELAQELLNEKNK